MGFIFGGDTGETAQSLRRKRKMAQAMLSRRRTPQNVGQGIAAIGEAIAGRVALSRLNAQSAAGQASASTAMNAILGGGQGDASSSVSEADVASSSNVEPAKMSGVDPSIKSGIAETAQALGIDPVDLATAISYETAGTFDPTKRGPTTKWGQHRGLIQFGEPQARQHGVDWEDPIGSQLGPDGAVANYLRSTGVKPGMGLLDVYSAINAGGVGLYDRSDTAAGGAPGTVRDKVEKQMSGHRQKALALMGGTEAFPEGANIRSPGTPTPDNPMGRAADALGQTGYVGNVDFHGRNRVGIGDMSNSPEARPSLRSPIVEQDPVMTSTVPQDPVTRALMQQSGGNIASSRFDGPGALSDPGVIAQGPPQVSGVGLPRVVQALMGGGAPPPAQAATQGVQVAQAGNQYGIDPRLMDVLGNPHINPGQRAVAEALLKRQLAASGPKDPLNEVKLERERLALENDRNPEPKTIKGADGFNYFLTGPKAGQRVLPDAVKPIDAPTVQKLKLDDGSEVAVQWDEAKGNWVPIDAPEGGGIAPTTKKLTESQSKLTLFQSLQTETQPVLLDLEKQFNPANLPDAFARGVLGGNFFQTTQGQMYDAAATAWAEGALRIATGAAATPEEMERTKRAYFAQPGDSPETIQFKAQMREMYDRSIERGLGRTDVDGSLPKPSEFAKTVSPNGDGLPEGVTEEDIQFTMEKHGLTREQVLERLK